MTYYINIKKPAKDFIDSLDKPTKEKIVGSIENLSKDPTGKGKYIGKLYSKIPFFEKRLFFGAGYRIYYSVYKQTIVIDSISYDGNLDILLVGTKQKQKKDICQLKKS